MNVREIREQLIRRRDEIMSIVSKVDRHIGHREAPFERDAGERALELENLEALFAIDRETRLELRKISEAIDRIDIGHYGFCSECGTAINVERLAALPYVDACVTCAQRAEGVTTVIS